MAQVTQMTQPNPSGASIVAAPDDVETAAAAVAAAVRAVPGVVRLSSGSYGEVATYLPGRRISGVRLGPAGVQVNLVAEYGPNLPELAERVRTAVRNRLATPATVDISIDDLADPLADEQED